MTARREYADAAAAELRAADPGLASIKMLGPSERLQGVPGGYYNLVSSLRADPLSRVFVRHIFPVEFEGGIESFDAEAFIGALGAKFAGKPFSVQTRWAEAGGACEKALKLTARLEDMFGIRGYARDDKNPEWAVSLYAKGDFLYAGASMCAENLSRWSGGEMRFKRDGGMLSRAEFKLLEAFETFSIQKPDPIMPRPQALDLGASPGGWSRVLLSFGYGVTAVDPSEMDPSLSGRPGFRHIKAGADRLAEGLGPFDFVTNDMRTDMFESCRLMFGLHKKGLVSPGGSALMTLKLMSGQKKSHALNALKLLGPGYVVVGARQLFHNRDEVTVYLRCI